MKKIPDAIVGNIFKVAICCGSMAIGGSLWAFAGKDRILLLLSATIAVIGIAKTTSLYMRGKNADYEIVEGTVTAVQVSKAHRQTRVSMACDDGTERSIPITGKVPVELGMAYRLYLTKPYDVEQWRVPDRLAPAQNLLGMEKNRDMENGRNYPDEMD
jgi:hypothetical protein